MERFVVPEIIFGNGIVGLIGQYAKDLAGKRVFIVTDPGIQAAGLLPPVLASLQQKNISYTVFSDVSENPRSSEVVQGLSGYKEEKGDVIIALGGGSAMDCAKGIAFLSVNGGRCEDYEGVDKIRKTGPPVMCIPTTAGSSADISQFAIIKDLSRFSKMAIISKKIVPVVSLLDPQLLITLSPYRTACTGVDALVHAIEAFVSKNSSKITRVHSLEAIKVIYSSLSEAVSHPYSIKHREQLTFGSLQAGMAFSNAGLGAVHAMAHSLGGLLDLPHGECNSLLVTAVIQKNFPYAPAAYKQVLSSMGVPVTGLSDKNVLKELTERFKNLLVEIGITGGLKERGIEPSSIDTLTDLAVSDACLLTNPCILTKNDIKELYEECM